MSKVVLDPGHQKGADSGASGNNLHEEDITLAICLQLKPLLQYNGIETILTREGNYANGPHSTLDESLQTRVAIANNFNADLFVSVHVNAGGGTGTEVLIAGTGGKAETAANKMLYYLNQVGGWANRGVKTQNVYVLRRTNAPAILTENGFIDSVSDSTKLKNPTFIRALAVAHAKGICDYFGITYKEGVIIMSEPIKPVKGPIASDDIYLSARVRESLVAQAIKDINKLGFAAKRMDLA
jgi:N-acetylmuramoyl-L-alanine amidase